MKRLRRASQGFREQGNTVVYFNLGNKGYCFRLMREKMAYVYYQQELWRKILGTNGILMGNKGKNAKF